jgi:hypothetical protein
MNEKFPVGTVLKNRQVIDIKTIIQTPIKPVNKGNGHTSAKKYRKVYLMKCLDCAQEIWSRLDGARGTNPSRCACRNGRYPQRYPRTKKWTVDYWVSVGRPYKLFNGRHKNSRREMVRQFLYTEQNGLCKLCNQSLNIVGSHIDHNHATDIVRGLVHAQCNYLIGVIEMLGFPASIPAILAGIFEYFKDAPPELGPPAAK